MRPLFKFSEFISWIALTLLCAPPAFGNSVTDSSYGFSGDFAPDTRLVRFDIELSDSNLPPDLVDVPTSGGHLDKRVYFLHGPGDYKINIFYSSNPDRYQDPRGIKFFASKSVTNSDTRDLSFLLPSGDVQSDDMAKAKTIHDWIGSNIQYDAASYFDGSYAHKSYDASRIMSSHLAVCYGYSNLFAALARAVGLRTKVITGAIIWPSLGQTWEKQGQTQEHAWNEVFVDGRWVTVDTTWDSGSMDFQTRQFTQALQSKYFDPAPELFEVDHQKIREDVND